VDGGEEIVGSIPVRAKKFRLIASRRQPGDVKNHVLVSHRDGQGGLIVEISRYLPDPESVEEIGFARRADQRGDFVPIPHQGFDEVTPDEPRRPGHQRLHTGRSYMR
jgi:hypothetical protein